MKTLIRFKPEVKFKEFNDFYQEVFNALINVWAHNPSYTPTVTSANDGVHMVLSYHYKNLALDIRVKDLRKDKWPLYQRSLKDLLGDTYDVILEKDHIHVEPSPTSRFV